MLTRIFPSLVALGFLTIMINTAYAALIFSDNQFYQEAFGQEMYELNSLTNSINQSTVDSQWEVFKQRKKDCSVNSTDLQIYFRCLENN